MRCRILTILLFCFVFFPVSCLEIVAVAGQKSMMRENIHGFLLLIIVLTSVQDVFFFLFFIYLFLLASSISFFLKHQ